MSSRSEAKTAGSLTYFTGRSCPRGHVALRYVSSFGCVECAAERALKPEVKAQKAEYQRLNAAQANAYKQTWLLANSNKRHDTNVRYYQTHKETESLRTAAWARANPGRVGANVRKRQTAKMRRTPSWADQSRIRVVYECAAQMSAELGVLMEVDHVLPLQGEKVSGLHVHNNLQLLTASRNRSKGNKYEVAA